MNRVSNDPDYALIQGQLVSTWGMGERVVPKAMSDTSLNRHILDISFRHYELASRYALNKRVLDIACGSGYGSNILKQSGAATVLGVDICSEAVEYANQQYLLQGIEFICDDAEQFDCSDTFDVICSFETLEHLKSPEQFLQKLYRLLSAEGDLLLSVPLGETRHFDPYHLHAFSKDDIFSLLNQAGFSVDLYRLDVFKMSRSDLLNSKSLYPESNPSMSDLLLTYRGLRTLYDFVFRDGFKIPQLMVCARKIKT
ncbi:MAG: class I SAM-dependent methyltransferase [Cyanobacteria bacterium P01_E01_bin.6]